MIRIISFISGLFVFLFVWNKAKEIFNQIHGEELEHWNGEGLHGKGGKRNIR